MSAWEMKQVTWPSGRCDFDDTVVVATWLFFGVFLAGGRLAVQARLTMWFKFFGV